MEYISMNINDFTLIYYVTFFSLALVVLNILSYFSERSNVLPSVIWTLGLGIVYGGLTRFSDLNIPVYTIEPHVIMYTLVPILIFSSSKEMCLHHFRKVLKESTLLATLGIVISTSIIALPLYYILGVPLLASLLFGVIISATDPIAVSAIMQQSKSISETTKMLIEGESILNDGFVVAVFLMLLTLIFSTSEINYLFFSAKFIFSILFALLIGFIMGKIARIFLSIWGNNSVFFAVNITLSLAFGTFLIAETFHLPAILAIFTAALTFAYKPDMNLEETNTSQKNIWSYLSYISNQILFFLLGSSFFQQVSFELITLTTLSIAIVSLLLSRLVALSLLKSFIKIDEKKMNSVNLWLLNFSGSRGAISIALILLLPDNFAYKPIFLTLSFIMVILSLIVYPIILKKIIDTQ